MSVAVAGPMTGKLPCRTLSPHCIPVARLRRPTDLADESGQSFIRHNHDCAWLVVNAMNTPALTDIDIDLDLDLNLDNDNDNDIYLLVHSHRCVNARRRNAMASNEIASYSFVPSGYGTEL
ncbi:unnamed protein product [Soboliphyme baturini]|uniref:CUB domain-containing protein n=1 Tax=Soboliphyme baturini TaxID=241478 RepID=A0A183J4E3_9BILA|nr:unnamed protein product [Soboliphyme baturini]